MGKQETITVDGVEYPVIRGRVFDLWTHTVETRGGLVRVMSSIASLSDPKWGALLAQSIERSIREQGGAQPC